MAARGRKDMQRSSKASDGGSIPSESTTKVCPKCKIEKNINDFYTRRGAQTHSYCKPCVHIQTIERQRNLKKLAIEYKGGKCVDCGIIDHACVYDFHHLDQTEKDFTIAHRKQYKFDESMQKELDKCVLLCSNCHRKRHVKY